MEKKLYEKTYYCVFLFVLDLIAMTYKVYAICNNGNFSNAFISLHRFAGEFSAITCWVAGYI